MLARGGAFVSFARGFQARIQESSMTGVVVVGAQWGDEGKGKIVD